MRTISIALALTLTLTACSDGDDETASPTSGPTSSAAAATTTTEAEDTDPIGDFSIDDQESDHFADNEVALLTDVRAADHRGYTRIVFELDGDDPTGWKVGWQDGPITQDGSGEPVDVEGPAYLVVTMSAAAAVDLSGEEHEITFEPDRVDGAGPIVNEVVKTGDFEAVLSWVIGVDREAPFAVAMLESPQRLVIDIETS